VRAQIDVLKEVFEEWMKTHDLDYDYGFYSDYEWRERGETLLEDAELILIFENQLTSILNYTGPWEIEEELQELAGGFGYYFDHGNTWNIGFYPLDEWAPLPDSAGPYTELLKDSRWQAKRKRILSRSRGICENCSAAKPLHVHHCYYRFGRHPWQYPDASLLALCEICHADRGKVELLWRSFMPRFTIGELELLRESLGQSLYWYDRERLFEFLKALDPDTLSDLRSRLDRLVESRGHPEERVSGLEGTAT
jgi:hypothetical protein